MIVKMKFLSITGPKRDLDRAINTYVSKYEMQLENAISELKTVKHLHPLNEVNPYKDYYTKTSEYLSRLGLTDLSTITRDSNDPMTLVQAQKVVDQIDKQMDSMEKEKNELETKKNVAIRLLEDIKKFLELNYDVDEILKFKFMKYRFGKLTTEYYEKFEKYVDNDLDAIFCKCHSDESNVWGVYFVPASCADKVDAVFSSLHFERIHLSDEYDGTPQASVKTLENQIKQIASSIEQVHTKIKETLTTNADTLKSAYALFYDVNVNYEARKYAACIKDAGHEFFILCGWMTEEDAKKVQNEIENDPDLFCLFEEDHNNIYSKPPTKLKNPRLFRPFEFMTRMYGLPNYKEFDPTILVALTYSFIFGAMFGDAGQGLVLLIGGALLYHFKKMNLAACISCAGVFSTFFGVMFGSFFGFEDLIPAIWLRPMNAMTNLPFIGQLNTVFIVAVAFGMFLTLTAMGLHIYNCAKMKDTEGLWFDANGVAGFVFYGIIVAVLVVFMTGHTVTGIGLVIALLAISLICIAWKEPLAALLDRKKDAIPKQKGMFLLTAFFELFEVLLSYFSNTLSFVRIGAFAVSHAAMMGVVLMLGGAEAGNINWIVIILGNIVVCAMEGLIVGIQVLRLEYYEMFSRYYKGDGREFKPFIELNK